MGNTQQDNCFRWITRDLSVKSFVLFCLLRWANKIVPTWASKIVSQKWGGNWETWRIVLSDINFYRETRFIRIHRAAAFSRDKSHRAELIVRRAKSGHFSKYERAEMNKTGGYV